MAMSTAGVCLLIARYDPLAAMERVAVQDLGLAAGTAAALIAVLLSAGGSSALRSDSLRAALVGTAAGIGDGMSDSMNRLAGAWLDPQAGWIPPTSMGVAAIALLLAFGFQGFVSAQNALKLHRANTVAPFILTAQMLVPIAMGATIYGQSLPHGGLSLASWLAGLALTLGGIATLSSSAPKIGASGISGPEIWQGPGAAPSADASPALATQSPPRDPIEPDVV
jgi:hypothetical protein